MAQYGFIVNDISGLGKTSAQIGGEGLAYWKMLMNGTHLVGPWNCVEFVVLTPGSSVGQHIHTRTEEIYYIISGEPTMTIDGAEYACRPGDVITAPIGTEHGIRNNGKDDVEFFVVEVFPGKGNSAPVASVNIAVGATTRFDLTNRLSGGWQFVERIEVLPGEAVDLAASNHAEVLFLLAGSGSISVDDEPLVAERGFSLASPPYSARRIQAEGVPMHVLRLAVAA